MLSGWREGAEKLEDRFGVISDLGRHSGEDCMGDLGIRPCHFGGMNSGLGPGMKSEVGGGLSDFGPRLDTTSA